MHGSANLLQLLGGPLSMQCRVKDTHARFSPMRTSSTPPYRLSRAYEFVPGGRPQTSFVRGMNSPEYLGWMWFMFVNLAFMS